MVFGPVKMQLRVYFTEETYNKLSERSIVETQETGDTVSMGRIVRRAVNEYLAKASGKRKRAR